MKKPKATRAAPRTRREEPRPDPYAKLRPIMESRQAGGVILDDAFGRIAERLMDSGEEGTLQISVAAGDEVRPSVIHVGKGARVTQGGTESPRFEVIIETGALEAVLTGARSPISAMAEGRMRVRGDLEFGKHVYRRLAGDAGVIDPCEPWERTT